MGWLSDIKEGLRRRKLAGRSPDAVFRDYYLRNKWGDRESRSGKGSSLVATENLRRVLPEVVREVGVSSILDLPCGDFHWMQHVDMSGIDYLGGDIVPEMIERNRERHGGDGVRFAVIDLIAGPVPKVGLVLTRDCLVHLSNAHVRAALDNIRRSGSEWLLTTTFPGIAGNQDISTGQWRKIDLTLAPFALPPPDSLIAEGQDNVKGQQRDKMLGLWKVQDLPDFGPAPAAN